jgi:hypothetical protein
MADDMFSMSFDPQSLSEIAQFYGFKTYLSEEVQAALQQGGSTLVASIQGAMHWQNPTGALSDSIAVVSESQMEIVVGSDLPYAHRRDQGFSGTDSLGRQYNDSGAFFMQQGIDASQSAILASVEAGAQQALNRLGNS